ncbi:unnamed protein product [Hyaloperonospora brassicae]|uniref:RxLR effector candidate protein n=1 Tax=Hyaloperonospora brassicae TaxID=162125 RepID=A0AAV0UUM6_HYABA|nr:unnamed protein product [Hyaloperonospora brassicae]
MQQQLQLQWQAAAHLPERRMMVRRILQLSQSRCKATDDGRAVLLAKRIELALYSRAGSLTEYSNLATLRRRLQSLVASSVHEGAAVSPSALKWHSRKRPSPKSSSNSPCSHSSCHAIKRQRVSPSTSASSSPNSSRPSSLFAAVGEDCTRLVFAFLEGQEVMRHRELNRFAAAFLPTCVQTVSVEVAQLTHGVSARSSMHRMRNLQHLLVHKKGTFAMGSSTSLLLPAPVDSSTAPLYAWGCAELPTTQSNDGEWAVGALAAVLRAGTFPALQTLHLVSVFINTMSGNGLGALCEALATGCCPLLADVLLAGNSLADVGAFAVARLLQSPRAPQLTRVDVRRNFIGETGLRALLSALAQTQPQVQVLCLGGNLVTDNCVPELQQWLAGPACPNLRFLGLEDNFLSAEGAQVVLETAAANATALTRPRRVSCDRKATMA